MEVRDAVIVDAVRTPMGKGRPGGVLSDVHAVELLAQTFAGLMGRHDLDPAAVDDVLVGCVSQVNEQGQTPGRWAWLGAGLPESVPAATIDRRCGSSHQAVDFAAIGVMAGVHELVVAGGVESMSRVPMGSARIGADPVGPSATERYAPGVVSQGVSAEIVAAKWGLSRPQLDEFAVRSHHRAADACADGAFAAEIVPVVLPDGSRVLQDETIRATTTTEKLAKLQPAFVDEEIAKRFPEIRWAATAGNSSQITDGAAALLIASRDAARRLGLRPRARLVSFAVTATDPITMLTAPIPATEEVLRRAGLRIGDIDLFEVNEAFASVPLAWQAEFDVPSEKLNVRGGAIALGHPLGASGARLITTMLHALEARSGRYGLITMCEAGGMANATIIERL